MRKRVDPRVKTLVEHCVLLHQRAFLVIIGDRGAEQVVNLHYLLQQLCAGSPFGTANNGSTSSSSGQNGGKKGRCSVLWCYKKDLGFSSHRKKRSKQLKKKMQRGLYDPCRDDPFELFLSSTEIRYCYYKETHAILGSTYTMLVLQDFEALTPNILCRTIETVQGGGLVCLLLRSFSSLQQLYGLCMDFHARLRPTGAAAAGATANAAQTAQQQLLQQLHEVQPRFNERFFLSLTRCRNCLIVDDELNVLPLTSFASHLLPLHQHAVAAARAAATGTDAAAAAAAAASAAYAAAFEPAALGSGSSSGKKKGSTSVKERETLVRRQQQILAENEKQRMQLVEIRQQFRGIPPVGPLVDLCVTPDQAKAVLAFLDCLATASASTAAATPAAAPGVGRGEAAAAATAAGGALGGAAVTGEHNALRTAAAATAARRRIVGFETFALTAARGRGKSAALGLAVAGAIAYDYSNIFVCAPGAENVKTLFEFVVKGLTAVGLKEHVDFTLKREDAVASAAAAATAAHSSGMQSSNSSNLEGGEQQLLPGRVAAAGGGGGAAGAQQPGISRLILGVEVKRRNALHKQTVSFLPAAAAASGSSGKEVAVLNNADLLVIDEAASIPIPVVKALFGPYVVLFSSTVNGYEGTGRALSLKLIQDLRQNRLALQQRRGAAGCFRCLREISLLTPIRYAAGDGVEAWLHDLLCLDATQPPKLSQAALPPASRCSLYLVDRDALFSYHAAAEKFLHALLSLFVSSHYKNSPNDLLLLADAPAHLLFVLLPPIHDAATLPDIYCAIQVAIEGALSKQAIRQALGRGLRPSGDLLPWTLSQHFVDEDFGCLTGARIVRIACHPSLQRMGYGSAALQQLIEYFEKKKVTLQDPLCCSPAVAGPSVAAAAGSDEEEEESDEDEAAAAAGDRETEDANAAEDLGDVAAAAAACSSPAEAGRARRESDLLNGEGRASGEAATAPAAGANSKLKKGLKKPGTAETSSSGASPPSPRSRNTSSTSASAAADEADTSAVGADSSAADPEAAAAKAFVASLSRKSLRKRSTLPPLLLPCSSSPPAFRIHYFGVAFGLTAQLFRFWNRKHFIPVYLRHVPTDVTGEHSCIMLRPATAAAAAHPVAAANADQSGDTSGAAQEGGEGLLGREDGSWIVPFAVDFRARLLQLLAGCFRSLPSSLSLCLISSAAAAVWRKRGSSSSSTSSADSGASEAAGAAQTSAHDNSAAVFPPVTLNNLHEFLSAHDVLRLRKYAQQLADLPLILDLLPTLAALFFNDRLPAAVTLSPLQQAVLLAVGAQRKNPDVVATEYNIPYNQTLALLSKTVHKFSSFFQRMQEEAVAAEVEQQWGRPAQRLVVEGGDALLGELPPQSFAEELQESSRTVNRLQKEELQQLINSFGKDAVGEFSMESISNDDFKAALRGRCPGATPDSSTVLSLKRKNFAKDYQARKSSSSSAAQAAGPKAEGNSGRKQLKRKRAKA